MEKQRNGEKAEGFEEIAMIRKIGENRRAAAGALLFAGAVFFAGCGAGNGMGQTAEREQSEMADNDAGVEQQETKENTAEEAADASAEDTEAALDNGSEEQAETDADVVSPASAQELLRAQTRHYYGDILSQVMAAWRLPDMELGTGTANDSLDAAEMAKNCFAVADVDLDGREELLVRWTTTITAGEIEAVYDYNPVSGVLKNEFVAYPALTYYDNGIIKAEWSHNQVPPAEFWPCTFYRYDAESDSYAELGSLRAWDDGIEGWELPDGLDVDGDGTVYEIQKAGEEYQAYEGFRFNKAEVDEWLGGFMEGAKELAIEYLPMKHESFEDFTPAYLKMLAEEAGKGRTDTAADLGLLILNEDRFLDAAQNLLSEKYGVEMEQPDPDFEEWTVGKKDGKELFSFEALDGGNLGYRGEKLEDVTIFGIYPGISVDGAWEILQAYGFYAASYPEVENCLVTGEGFGNISIWFSAEDNVVTDITPYCAFAG